MDLYGGDGPQSGQVLPEGVRTRGDHPGADPRPDRILGEPGSLKVGLARKKNIE